MVIYVVTALSFYEFYESLVRKICHLSVENVLSWPIKDILVMN